MAEILLPDCQFRRLSDGATCRDIQPQAMCQACTAHVQVAALRTRLESAEAARRDAQESRLDLIIQNEELGAELAALRARLESVEAALRRVHPDFIVIPRRGYVGCRLCFTEAEREEPLRHANFCPFAALGAACEG